MAESIDDQAKQFRNRGWDKEAKELEKQAARFRKAGVPEKFDTEEKTATSTNPPVEIDQREKFKEEREKYLKALVEISEESGGKIELTADMAERLNQKVGSGLPDELELGQLQIPSKGTHPLEVTLLSPTEREAAERLPNHFRKSHNTMLNDISRTTHRYPDRDTLAAIRKKDAKEWLITTRGIGYTKLVFLKTAFKKPEVSSPAQM